VQLVDGGMGGGRGQLVDGGMGGRGATFLCPD